MNDFAQELTNVMNPDFVDKLGMSKPPFSEIYDPEVYYENDNKINIQKKISHLLEYTSLVLFIQGAEGIGKTSILKKRIENTKPDWEICYLSAKDYISIDALIEKLALDLKLNLMSNNEGTTALSIQEQLDGLAKTAKLPILIIDDIDELSENLIPTLASLAFPPGIDKPLLRLIIAGEDIPEALENTIPKTTDDEKLKYLPVLPLTEAETGEYINFRIKDAGYEKSSPFTPNIVNKIYLDAKGFPKSINQLANHFLSQFAQGNIEKPSILNMSENNKQLKIAAGALASIVIIIIGVIAFSGDDIDETENKIKSLPVPTPAISSQEKGEVKNPTQPDISEPTTIAKAPTETVDTPPQKKELTKHRTISPTQVAATEEIKIKEAPKAIIEKTIERPVTKVTLPKKKRLRTPQVTLDWIKEQHPRHYTLQLIGGSQKASVEGFIKKHRLEKSAYIFSTSRDGKIWYSVVYNSYSTLKKARRASESLPTSLSKIKPWVRTFDHVKKDVR